jgi:hypothetical protein
VEENKSTPVLNFTVGDDLTPVANLTVNAGSSNTTLVPAANIFLGGSGASRTVFITPATGQSGTATITLTVSDGSKTASTSFTLTVAENTAPTISAIANQNVGLSGAQIGPLSFTVGDAETAPGSLTVTPSTSNPALVPIINIVLGGSGANRLITITPKANVSGSTTITIKVSDGQLDTSKSFIITAAQTEPTVLTLVKDYNKDNWSDLLLQQTDGSLGAWFLNGTTFSSAVLLSPSNVGDTAYRVAATADFNGDGKIDILFQHTDGTLAVWLMDGTKLISAAFISPANPGSTWRVKAAVDLNGDNNADLIFQNTDGTLAAWMMNGISLVGGSLLNPPVAPPGWELRGAGEFNGDGKPDLLLQHTDGSLAVWLMNGLNLTQGAFLNPASPGDANWKAIGTADFNRDGKSDIVLQHAGTNDLAAWIMDGINLKEGKLMGLPAQGWKVVGP